MARYYVNTRAQRNSGDHEVHKQGCRNMPEEHNREYLGDFTTCHGAVAKAKQRFPKSDGCASCCPACHTS